MISFTLAIEAVCSVYTLTTMLARVRNAWIIHYNKSTQHYIQSGVEQLQKILYDT